MLQKIYDLAEMWLKLFSDFDNDVITFLSQIHNLDPWLHFVSKLISFEFKEKKKFVLINNITDV